MRKYKNERMIHERAIEKAVESDLTGDRTSIESVNVIDFHRKWFSRFDAIMDMAASGPRWLSSPNIRKIVSDKLLDGDGPKYQLDAFSIMSNHVHVVLQPNLNEREMTEIRTSKGIRFESKQDTLAEIMQSIKGNTARQCNTLLDRVGSFWEAENFDHVIRHGAGLQKAIRYTLNNPVKAKLVGHWTEWPGNYLAKRLQDDPGFDFS
ncbi:MAG TPA: hypothetical protein PLP07_08360 [Pyrinomonadaceae bacterium]|nr:hypothetical protein [Chloracidobacterium sp.]MBP9934594.1 hypothetical protein [Pyrinomonadaceae bacterium]MBK7802856.1 hypothetical protein [Chloracidobacterium sp.]MBK9438500.1 hypothetical protein [Chloracidobacterium sp.]MBL0240620.1 hypothetical protein [Chloracidobacterium sp.]